MTHYPALWMINYADQVVIGGQPSKDAVESLLYSSGVGRHTSILYFNRLVKGEKVEITVSKYVWEHKGLRPNTFSYPVSCPDCRCLHSWQNFPEKSLAEGSKFTIKCKTTLKDGKKCTGRWDVPARPTSALVNDPYVGSWYKFS